MASSFSGGFEEAGMLRRMSRSNLDPGLQSLPVWHTCTLSDFMEYKMW